jgi:putative glutamine amidotransferase
MKPVIGVTMSYDAEQRRIRIGEEYINAVLEAGGIPILLPSVAQCDSPEAYLDRIDGLLLSGGGDIVPEEYGETLIENLDNPLEATPERDAFELPLTRLAIQRGVPILGICRGIQIICVACGGTLYQDYGLDANRTTVVKHTYAVPETMHEVTVAKGSKLYGIVGGERIEVNSSHHQTVKDVPNGFRVVARADDGSVEAMELTERSDYFLLGVQWHPERMIGYSQEAREVLEAFVKGAIPQQPGGAIVRRR